MVTVSEEEILDAMRFVVSRTKQLIEPSAASVFAVLFKGEEALADRRVGAVISGGNVDFGRLA